MGKKPHVESGPVEWERVALPVPAGYDDVVIKTIRGSAPDDIWILAVARHDGARAALSFHFDGTAWAQADVPARALAIVPLGKAEAWAVGVYGTVARWDGAHWTTAKIDGIDYDLDVAAGWHDDLWVGAAPRGLLHFDGARWLPVTGAELGDYGATAILALPDHELVVARHSKTEPPAVARLAGGAWRVEPVGPGGIVHLAASGPRDIWALGSFDHGYHFDGFAWSKFATSDTRVIAAAVASPSEAYAVGEGGLVLAWDGRAWRRSSAGTTARLWAVYAAPAMKALAGGEDGLFRHR